MKQQNCLMSSWKLSWKLYWQPWKMKSSLAYVRKKVVATKNPHLQCIQHWVSPAAFNYIEEKLPYQVELFVVHAAECCKESRVDWTLSESSASIRQDAKWWGLENYWELSGVLEDFQVSHGSAQPGNLSDHKSDFTLQSRDSCRAYRVSKWLSCGEVDEAANESVIELQTTDHITNIAAPTLDPSQCNLNAVQE